MIQRALLAAGLVATSVTWTLTTGGHEAVAGPATSGMGAHDISLRQDYGLPTDPDGLARAAAAGTTSAFGMPVTAQEEAGLQGRMEEEGAAQGALAAFTARARSSFRDAYAGVYFDQADNGNVVVLGTGKVDELVSRLRGALPSAWSSRISGTQVAYTEAVLQQQLDALDAARGTDADAAAVSLASLDLMHNRAVVSLDPQAPLGAEDRIKARYGDNLVLSRGTFSQTSIDRTYNFAHLRAGQRIQSSNRYCTANLPAKSSNGYYYLVTAGHCTVNVGYPWNEGKSSGTSLGTSRPTTQYVSGTFCDCGAVGPLPASVVYAYVYVDDATSQPIRHYLGSNPTLGSAVCWSGASTASNPVHCASVSDSSTIYNDSRTRYNQIGITSSFSPGDSGGPTYTGDTIYGVISGNYVDDQGLYGVHGYYSQTRYIGMNLTVLSCGC